MSTDEHPSDRPAHLAHHFDGSRQQYESAKLGMWIFLATEILMFGGLFVAYAAYRGTHHELVLAGSRFLDVRLGALNTAVLLTSSFTMAWAVRAAQCNQRRLLVTLLALTLLGGGFFLCVKFVEYKQKWEHGMMLGRFFHPEESFFAAHFQHGQKEPQSHHGQETTTAPKTPSAPAATGNPTRGAMVFTGTCAACHGNDATGVKNQGADLLHSKFIGEKSDKELLAFVKVGRQSWDADSTMKLQMPPRGGNPTLTDDHLRDAIAYLRQIRQKAEATIAEAAISSPDSNKPKEDQGVPTTWTAADLELLIPHSIIQPAAVGPTGLNPRYLHPMDTSPEHEMPPGLRPADLRLFFSIYFLLTGLHALHVIIGMSVIFVLIIASMRGRYSSTYYTPVDLGGLYWHLVDLIWIFLFPLLYLIR